jgi:hypothetical protein
MSLRELMLLLILTFNFKSTQALRRDVQLRRLDGPVLARVVGSASSLRCPRLAAALVRLEKAKSTTPPQA